MRPSRKGAAEVGVALNDGSDVGRLNEAASCLRLAV